MELCITNLLATFRLSSSVSSADTFSAGEGNAREARDGNRYSLRRLRSFGRCRSLEDDRRGRWAVLRRVILSGAV